MKDVDLIEMFSRPENDDSVMSAWKRLQRGDAAENQSVRSLIDNSWQRCQTANVDPERTHAPSPLQGIQLRTLQDQCNELVVASTPVMALGRDFLSETGTVMVLTDANGIVLSQEGDTSTLDDAEKVHLTPGADWSELTCGTNAIGTALTIGKPVQIHSAEHYCEGIKRWSCSATIIRDPLDDKTLGVIDISGLSHSYTRHALALVVSTAAGIESRLAQAELDIRCNLMEVSMDRISAAVNDGVILFDRRGRAIRANGNASLMLEDMACTGRIDPSIRLTDIDIGGNGTPLKLPEWANLNNLETVTVGGKQIGALLTLPNQQAHKRRIWSLPATIGESAPLPQRSAARKSKPQLENPFDRIIGRSSVIRDSVMRAQQLAKSRVAVLLFGETGVGKEVFARGIHDYGRVEAARTSNTKTSDTPFVALNCGGFSHELLKSELFGYVEGSFTGAKRGGMIGKIEAANGGTLFLDEIGEMPMDIQPHFLRVLEAGEICRLGENTPRKVNFRLIAATHRDLRQEVADGNFRMDLYFRIAVTQIDLPPLRERVDDIPLLITHYMQLLAKQHGLAPAQIADGVMERLKAYTWPGNVRELRNVIEGLLLTSIDGTITERSLPPNLLHSAENFAVPTPPTGHVVEPNHSSQWSGLELSERQALMDAITACKGNMTHVARTLRIAKSTLYLKLKRFDLEQVVEAARQTNAP